MVWKNRVNCFFQVRAHYFCDDGKSPSKYCAAWLVRVCALSVSRRRSQVFGCFRRQNNFWDKNYSNSIDHRNVGFNSIALLSDCVQLEVQSKIRSFLISSSLSAWSQKGVIEKQYQLVFRHLFNEERMAGIDPIIIPDEPRDLDLSVS